MTDSSGITVTGYGSAGGAPDVVRLSLAAEARHASVQQALDDVAVALTSMRTVLGDGGVALSDLRSTEATLWSGSDKPGSRTMHTARFGLEVTVRQVDEAGRLLAAALDAAGDSGRMNGMAFAHADESALQAQARETAMHDARARAEQLAGLAGRQLGPVQEVVEGTSGGPPVPVDGRMFALAAAPAVPVSGGQLEVTARVVVRWAWA